MSENPPAPVCAACGHVEHTPGDCGHKRMTNDCGCPAYPAPPAPLQKCPYCGVGVFVVKGKTVLSVAEDLAAKDAEIAALKRENERKSKWIKHRSGQLHNLSTAKFGALQEVEGLKSRAERAEAEIARLEQSREMELADAVRFEELYVKEKAEIARLRAALEKIHAEAKRGDYERFGRVEMERIAREALEKP